MWWPTSAMLSLDLGLQLERVGSRASVQGISRVRGCRSLESLAAQALYPTSRMHMGLWRMGITLVWKHRLGINSGIATCVSERPVENCEWHRAILWSQMHGLFVFAISSVALSEDLLYTVLVSVVFSWIPRFGYFECLPSTHLKTSQL